MNVSFLWIYHRLEFLKVLSLGSEAVVIDKVQLCRVQLELRSVSSQVRALVWKVATWVNLRVIVTLVNPSASRNITARPLLELDLTTTRPPLCLLLKIFSPMVRSCKLVASKLWSSCTFPPTKRLLLRPPDLYCRALHASHNGKNSVGV